VASLTRHLRHGPTPRSERIHEAPRAATVAQLTVRGWPQDAAEEAVLAWEAMVEAEGHQPDDPGYWEGRDEWAAESDAGVPGQPGPPEPAIIGGPR